MLLFFHSYRKPQPSFFPTSTATRLVSGYSSQTRELGATPGRQMESAGPRAKKARLPPAAIPVVDPAPSSAGRSSECRRAGNGGTQTCLPAAYGVAQGVAQCGPSSLTRAQDPREGPSLTGRTTGSSLRRSLIRLAREEAERSRWGTSRGAHDASHDDLG